MRESRVLIKVYVPSYLKEAVKQLAENNDVDVSSFVRELLEDYVNGKCVTVNAPGAKKNAENK